MNAAVGSFVLALASNAHADQVSAEKRAAAQVLFDDAGELTKQHKFAEACPKLLESYNLDPAIGTKFYLAKCYESLGKLASAWTCYLEVAAEAQKQGAADKEKFANERAVALKPKVPRLKLDVGPQARAIKGLSVRRDEVDVGEGSFGVALPVDLGDHLVTAKAPGKKAWETHVELKEEGGLVRVEVPMLEADGTDVANGTKGPINDKDKDKDSDGADHPPPPPRWQTTQGVAGLVIGSIGILSLGGGIGAGVAAMSKQKASNAPGYCTASTDTCNSAGHSLREQAIQAATASTALFVVGGAAVVGGGVLLLTAPSGDKPKTSGAVMSVGFGPGSVSVMGRF